MEPRKCKVCGETFQPKSWHQERCYKKECHLFKLECAECHKTFELSHKRKYCSLDCKRKALEKQYITQKPFTRINTQVRQTLEEFDMQEHYELKKGIGDKTINMWLVSEMSRKLRDQIVERDNSQCYICSSRTNLHVHHIIRRSYGGGHDPDNLITLCSGCHRTIDSCDTETAIKRCVKRAILNVKGLRKG